jgi:hypothetical protein
MKNGIGLKGLASPTAAEIAHNITRKRRDA